MGRESYGLAWYKKTQTTCWNWLGLSKFSVNSCPRFDRYHVRFPRAISLISKNEKWKISYDSKLSFESKWAVIFENSMRPKRFYHPVFDQFLMVHTVWSFKMQKIFWPVRFDQRPLDFTPNFDLSMIWCLESGSLVEKPFQNGTQHWRLGKTFEDNLASLRVLQEVRTYIN